MQVAQQVTTLYGQWEWHKKHHCQDQKKQAEMSVEHFKLYQQATGFNFEPFGLLFFAELEHPIFPASQYVHDWMHTLVANGVFHTAFTAWLEAANGHLDIYKELEKYLTFGCTQSQGSFSTCSHPRGRAATRKQVFSSVMLVKHWAWHPFCVSTYRRLSCQPMFCLQSAMSLDRF